MTHTPGPLFAVKGDTLNPDRPWGVVAYMTLEECRQIDGDEATPNSRTVVIAEVTDGPTAEGDATLYAAAPDLLAALRAIRDYARDSRTGRMLTHEGYELAEAAIAKAEGRS